MTYKTTIKRSFYDNTERELIINPDFLQFEDKNHKDNLYTILKKEDISAYCYGIKWIRGFKFTIGRDYQIYIKSKENKILKINFKGFYGRNKEAHHEKFYEILAHLWENYFSDFASIFIEKHNNNEPFSIGKLHFEQNGITIENAAIIGNKKTFIPWGDIETKNYFTYFAVFSIKNPSTINQCYYYKDEWNTTLIYSVLRTILKEKSNATHTRTKR